MDLQEFIKFIQSLTVGAQEVIGLDIGASAIKMVEMDKTGEDSYKISRYTSVPLAEGTIIDDEIHNEDELLRALRLGLKQLKSKRLNVCIGLSGPNTILKKLQLPDGLPVEELEDQVEWDLEQYLPFPVEEAHISSSVVRINPGSLTDVLAGAAKKALVNSYKTTVEKANVKVKIVDIAAAAALNVLDLVYKTQLSVRGSNWLLLDVGASKTKFLVCKGGILTFTKEINIGGNSITEEIQREIGVTFLEAQSLKIHGDGQGNIPEEVLLIIKQVMMTFMSEIATTRDFWLNASGEHEFNGCALTGGGALLPGIIEQLTEVLSTEVLVLNPFSKITYNKNTITEDMINEIAYQGVSAIGLGMRRVTQ
jgi:type IV pilus assembly protein PilM